MTQQKKEFGFNTQALHAGQTPDPATLSRGVPVYRTSSYVFKSTEHAANLFALKELGNIYTRLMNPTHDILEKRISALEGGAASVAVASGTNAIFYTVINIAKSGDEIVSANNLYGGTYTMFDAILPNFGITTKFVKPSDPENFEKAITDKTKLLYLETIGNPVLDVTDIEEVSKIARRHNLPLVVDATFTTPYLLRAIEHGADIVVNSLTKWIGGHGSAIGGIVTDSGKFNWQDKKFPLFTEPDPNYHGLKWAYDLPEALAPIAFALRLRTVPLRNLGGSISPDNAWIFIQGTETLPLRMARHSENALLAAQYLKNHPGVEWVRYPGLKDDPSHQVAAKYLKKGFGGMVVFGIKGGLEAGKKFIEALQLFSHLANVGDAKSLALHPASTSHSQIPADKQLEAGLTPDLIRLSIGLEDIDDIIWDIEQALKKAIA
ncbi:MAG: aminotransferase class I/II-fold pyridoxal phosphate-dependent enzyme [Candidatus Omnitrophota bacterium]|nr:aminotransferase class I/II-fold pyridoxal phosphate-dependent enzyme [Candidatus Omnitrophota bacterium]MBU3929303.1 aminotransferase class I/II-fold pyridoxal phosphate-dependent enzyme [bacterium]MBU4122388.1 aminotransferase class I/II-fold pyridoxal phosphate-dependent enzyme [bacterium]